MMKLLRVIALAVATTPSIEIDLASESHLYPLCFPLVGLHLYPPLISAHGPPINNWSGSMIRRQRVDSARRLKVLWDLASEVAMTPLIAIDLA